MLDPLDYQKPTAKPDPFWFNVLVAIGCAIGVTVVARIILDRFFGLSLPFPVELLFG